MFFVSRVKGNDIYIKDSKDNIEEKVKNRVIVRLMEDKILNIYGVSIYNHTAECKPISTDIKGSKTELRNLLDDLERVHNKWTLKPIEDYLASLKVGSVVQIEYKDYDSSGNIFHGTITIKKLDEDLWLYEDKNSTFTGDKGNSRFAADVLDIAYCSVASATVVKVG